MNNLPRQTLIALIAQHGSALSEEPRRVEAFLRDLCGQHKREIFVLVNALKCQVAADLLNSKGVPQELLLARLTQRLEDEMAVNTNAARWAVETWAVALSVLGQANSTRSTGTPITSTRSMPQSRPLQVTTACKSLPRLYPSILKKIQKITILSEEKVLGDGTEYKVSNVNKLMNAAYAAEVEVTDSRSDVMTVDGMEFCYVPSGPFIMGSDEENDEKPIHKVDIDYDYWLGQYPITVAQWRKFVQEASYVSTEQNNLHESANHPARFIRWQEAIKFCWWLTQRWRRTGYLDHNWIVRLPSEAEWEKAARGGLEIPQMPVIGKLSAFDFEQMPGVRHTWKLTHYPSVVTLGETTLISIEPTTVTRAPAQWDAIQLGLVPMVVLKWLETCGNGHNHFTMSILTVQQMGGKISISMVDIALSEEERSLSLSGRSVVLAVIGAT